jgi:hypothetical protein
MLVSLSRNVGNTSPKFTEIALVAETGKAS